MNSLKSVLIVTLSVMLSISQAYAVVVPDAHALLSDITESNNNIPDISILAPSSITAQNILQPDFTVASTIISGTQITDENVIEMQDVTGDEELLYSPLITNDHHFWTRGKIILGSTILLSTGLLLSLVFLLSGSGSGSGSDSNSNTGGSGGGSDPGNGGDPGQSGLNNGGDPGAGGPKGGTDNENLFALGGGGPNPDNSNLNDLINELGNDNGLQTGNLPLGIPHHPEPSTILLMGLGLLVPFFKKRLSL